MTISHQICYPRYVCCLFLGIMMVHNELSQNLSWCATVSFYVHSRLCVLTREPLLHTCRVSDWTEGAETTMVEFFLWKRQKGTLWRVEHAMSLKTLAEDRPVIAFRSHSICPSKPRGRAQHQWGSDISTPLSERNHKSHRAKLQMQEETKKWGWKHYLPSSSRIIYKKNWNSFFPPTCIFWNSSM